MKKKSRTEGNGKGTEVNERKKESKKGIKDEFNKGRVKGDERKGLGGSRKERITEDYEGSTTVTDLVVLYYIALQ